MAKRTTVVVVEDEKGAWYVVCDTSTTATAWIKKHNAQLHNLRKTELEVMIASDV